MFKKSITFLLLFTTIVTIITLESFVDVSAVGNPPDNCGETKISKPNSTKSHFFGLNCSACHTPGRKGKGCFTVAGSVLDEDRSKIYKNPVVKLYTEPKAGGQLVATIKGDALGNFYTTETIDFSKGLYPTLIGSPGAAEPIKHMTRPVFSDMGNCNRCHGYKKAEEALGID